MASPRSLHVRTSINVVYHGANWLTQVSAHALHRVGFSGDLDPGSKDEKSPITMETYDQADRESLLHSDR